MGNAEVGRRSSHRLCRAARPQQTINRVGSPPSLSQPPTTATSWRHRRTTTGCCGAWRKP